MSSRRAGAVSSVRLPRRRDLALSLHFCQDTRMIFEVSPTKDAVVIAQTTGSGEIFVIKLI